MTEGYFHHTCEQLRSNPDAYKGPQDKVELSSVALVGDLQRAASEGKLVYCSAQPVDNRDATMGVIVSPALHIGPKPDDTLRSRDT